MNNSLNAINTNISAISKAKSIVLDTSYRRNSRRILSSKKIKYKCKKSKKFKL